MHHSAAHDALHPNIQQTKEAILCVLALISVVAFGTVGFALIEQDWGVWKSLFITLVTITTVGYGDGGMSPRGEVFAAILLVVGIATATYSFSALVRFAVSHQFAWRRKMQKMIEQLSDHYVICGFGRIGKTVCQQLHDGGIPFVVIESDAAGYQEALQEGYLAIQGNSTEDEALREAGVEHAKGVVCVVNSDAENVFIALSAHELNHNVFIASRADADGAVRKIERAGASLVVSPYATAGSKIASAILRSQVSNHPRPADDGLELCEVTVASGTTFDGKTIADLKRAEPSISIVAVRHTSGKLVLNPEDDLQLVSGDDFTAAGRPEDLSRIYQVATTAERAQLEELVTAG